jgi:hypothetical protein
MCPSSISRWRWHSVPDPFPLFPVCRRHLDALTTEVAIMQHAKGAQSDPSHGYCTDDVARSLRVDLLHQRELGWQEVASSADRNIAFLADAFEDSTGHFRNLRRWDGVWLDAPGSEDADARALQALGEVIASAPDGTLRDEAAALFERALPTASEVGSLRARASVILACEAAAQAGLFGMVADAYWRAAHELWHAFADCAMDPVWPWPEPLVTYENELPAQALIVAGRGLDRPGMVRTGLTVLDWLIDAQMDADGHLRMVGNVGWWPREGPVARFDQQPISATTLLLAAATAFGETADPRYSDAMQSAYAWFLGRNDARTPVADPTSGASADGIGPAGVSRNQGAESTLMWLIALEHTRGHRARGVRTSARPGDPLATVA